ncbi:MAG: RidA family protein [Bacillus subtilis]|nr:RidA family protein [Bacillus subtilis]
MSGQLPFVPATMTQASQEIEAQTAQSSRQCSSRLLRSCRLPQHRHCQNASSFLKNMNQFGEMNQIYAAFFGDHQTRPVDD